MVDVFIRNVDEQAFRKLKARAAEHGHSLGHEVAELLENKAEKKGGAAAWLSHLRTVKLGKKAKNITERIDEIASGVALDDYRRYQHSG